MDVELCPNCGYDYCICDVEIYPNTPQYWRGKYNKAQSTADRQGELVDLVNKYRRERLITDRRKMFELAKELADDT